MASEKKRFHHFAQVKLQHMRLELPRFDSATLKWLAAGTSTAFFFPSHLFSSAHVIAVLRHVMVIENYVSISVLFFIEFNLHLSWSKRDYDQRLESWVSSLLLSHSPIYFPLHNSLLCIQRWPQAVYSYQMNVFFSVHKLQSVAPLCNVQLPSSDIVVVGFSPHCEIKKLRYIYSLNSLLL